MVKPNYITDNVGKGIYVVCMYSSAESIKYRLLTCIYEPPPFASRFLNLTTGLSYGHIFGLQAKLVP